MLRILIDRARRRKAVRHGGELHQTEYEEAGIAAPDHDDDEMLSIHELLDRFAEIEPRKAEVVKLRYFVGMTIDRLAVLERNGLRATGAQCTRRHERQQALHSGRKEAGGVVGYGIHCFYSLHS